MVEPAPFRLILVDRSPDVAQALTAAFAPWPEVEAVCGVFEELPAFDCLVSAANGFGLMDGGIDGAITAFFGRDLQNRVQAHILREFRGEQPVGTSFLIETGDARHPWLAHTPTMRLPQAISRTDNVYKAMAAALRTVWRHNRTAETPIATLACPGLGTATGRVPPREAARQMALAWRWFLNPPERITWDLAEARQIEVRYGGDDGLRFPPA